MDQNYPCYVMRILKNVNERVVHELLKFHVSSFKKDLRFLKSQKHAIIAILVFGFLLAGQITYPWLDMSSCQTDNFK